MPNYTISDHTPCAICNQGFTSTVSKLRTVEHNKVSANVSFCYSVCDHCGSETVDQEQSVWNRREVNRFKKRVDHIPLGADILAMRKRSGLTQAQMGELLGGGPVAFSKYEHDDLIPDEAMANLLRLAIADQSLIKQLQSIKGEYVTVTTSLAGHWTYGPGVADDVDAGESFQFFGAKQHINTPPSEDKWQLINQ
jgi:HTH-type transcriptional regulator/antitoxin MqsA